MPRQDGTAFFQHLNFACEVFKYITTYSTKAWEGFQVRQPESTKKGAYSTARIIFLQDIEDCCLCDLYVLRLSFIAAMECIQNVVRIEHYCLGATWGLDRIDQRDLPLDGNSNFNVTGSGVKAYIIDTGIRATHTEFAGRVISGFTAINDGLGTTTIMDTALTCPALWVVQLMVWRRTLRSSPFACLIRVAADPIPGVGSALNR